MMYTKGPRKLRSSDLVTNLLMVASSSPCCTFSQDTSLMAAGFEESYIRLWNLKGEPLNGLQSEFQLNNIRDCTIAARLLRVAR